MKIKSRLFLRFAWIFPLIAFASCVNEPNEDAFAEVVLTQGARDLVYKFTFPAYGYENLCFIRDSAGNKANIVAYRMEAYNGYDLEQSYEAFKVVFIPKQVGENGETVEASADIVFYEKTKDQNTAVRPRTFHLTSKTEFSDKNYTLSTGKGGMISCSWSIDEKKSVAADPDHTEYDVKSYNLMGVRFYAPVLN